MQVNLDGYPLPVKQLKGTDPVESLDLSNTRLGPASATVIASLIKLNASLTSLNLSLNSLNDETEAMLKGVVAGRDGFYLRV